MHTGSTALIALLALSLPLAGQYIPAGAHVQRSTAKLEQVEWERVKRSRDVQSIESFQFRFPKSRHVRDAERLIVQLEGHDRSRRADDLKPYTLVPENKNVVRAVPAEQPQSRQ